MSRGSGTVEQAMMQVILNAGRPMSYRDIAQALMQAVGINDFTERRLAPSRERSFRRALRNLVKKGPLIELNGQSERRYFFYPADVGSDKLCEQFRGNWDAAMAVVISTLRRIKPPPDGVPASMDARMLARGILQAALDTLTAEVLTAGANK